MKELPPESALVLARVWQPQRNQYGAAWQDLTHDRRPLLMEVACFEDSVLSQEVEKRFGYGSAVRCGLFNGCDLTTKKGVQLAKALVTKHRPVHVWISCACSPFCPLQRLNRNNPEQIEALDKKRADAILQYKGAQEVANVAVSVGSHIHWELAERCEAWQLDVMKDFVQKHGLQKVTCHGCTVGLRTIDKRQLLCKGWTIATKYGPLLRHMNLRCQRNHPKGECRGKNATSSSRYTSVFARKIVDCMCEQETWPKVLQELQTNQQAQGPQEEQAQANEQAQVPVDPPPEPPEPPEPPTDPTVHPRRKEIMKKIQHIHRVTGHGDMQALIKALQARGVASEVIEAAKAFKCPVCAEYKRPLPRRRASLETLPKKWERLQVDTGDWEHPVHKHKFRFCLMIDEGSRFRVGKAFSGPPRKAGTWEDFKVMYEQQWLPAHGAPASVRVDPAGPWLNEQADKYFAERGIFLDPVPAEAHWQIGVVERGIRSLKAVMDAIAPEFPQMSNDELLGRAVWVCNSRDLYRGFSPLQHASGRTPDEEMRLFDTVDEKPLHNDLMEDGGFGQNIRAMCVAEQAFSEEQAKQRVQRAQASGHRKTSIYLPGDLVYFWRKQVAGRSHQNFPKGRFIGPARVLATESRKEEDGSIRPGSVIWIHRGGRLLRASPEQLRQASPREIMLEELKGPVEIPWTFTSLATNAARRTYHDVSQEIPDEEEWELAQQHDPSDTLETELPYHEDQGPPKHRMRAKRSQEEVPPQLRSVPKEPRTAERRGQKRESESPNPVQPRRILAGVGSREAHPPDSEEGEESFLAVEISVEIPESRRGFKKFLNNPAAFLCQKLKKKQVEVSERQLTPDQREEFRKAKDVEVRNFVGSECFKAWKGDMADESEILGMRWLLTWKYDEKYQESGGRKAKARAVILGYQDPSYASRESSAPTPSKAGRQLFFQMCAWKQFKVQKGDVSGAFLQGDNLDERLFCRPLPEICKALNVDADTPMLMQKAAYGLVQAPLHWYRSVCGFLESLGYRRLKLEPCCWVYVDAGGNMKSMIHGHVDDFMFGGQAGCPVHEGLMEKLKNRFKWGAWEQTEFVQCGIHVRQLPDFSIELHQQKSIEELEEIHISRDRSRLPGSTTNEAEKTALRAVLGSLSWICGQTHFLHAVDVNFLITTIPVSTVAEILKANQVVRAVKKWKDLRLKIHAFPKEEMLEFTCWSDAAWANRPNETDSTEGIFVGVATRHLREGHETNVTPVYWRSGKIDRVCRSPAAAETIAAVDGEDDLVFLRGLWAEMNGKLIDPRSPDDGILTVPGHLITDAKNLFDKLHSPVLVVKGSEKRSSIEALGLRESMERSRTTISWVHGDAMLANSLTKTSEKHQALLYIQMGFRWKVIYDEKMMSAKSRRRQGMQAMESDAAHHNNTLTSTFHQPTPYHKHHHAGRP